MDPDYKGYRGGIRGYLSDLYSMVRHNKAVSATIFVAGILAPTGFHYVSKAVGSAMPTAEASEHNKKISAFFEFGTQNLEKVTQVVPCQLDGDHDVDLAVIADGKLILLENKINRAGR
jgi:hypothetical protein